MFVFPDVVGMIVALFAFALTVIGGVGGMLAHVSKKIDSRLERVENELVDVKVAIARIEGPPRRLQQL
ncbi:hypothetical protein [Microbacterium sp. A93]|uniref:hypothetical protein n=1 Tax=Microbacterium sp. A93 TaxID=3450716 RepID=UPI003F42FF8D